MVIHCCDDMNRKTLCIDKIECLNNLPDENKIIYFSSRFREYGIPIKDRKRVSSSYIAIQFCPWCGKQLPYSKRDEWFDELEKMGYESPLDQEIPEEFKNSLWYENK